MVTVVYNVSAR